ncbi:telomere-associated protein Tap [Streptomyces sp. NPDC057654]|uniref:telomere-associated protein Tap n=1 Tax=Streptomyces sp. NPDC057654 TaxID=3346196 RepID=UPI0036BF270F
MGFSVDGTPEDYRNGRSEPRSPRLEAYQRLLNGWAAKYPAAPTAPSAAPAPAAAPQPRAPETIPSPATPEPQTFAPAEAPAAPERPAPPAARPEATPRRPAAKKAAQPAADPRFLHGPLAVLDGDGSAYGVDGIVLDCPATTVPELVEWTLKESGLGVAKLNRYGKDSDPLIVLTAAAAVKLGLPERLEGHEQRRSLRLPEDHPVVKQVAKAKWQLTQRGFGPWARIYRKAQGHERQCVQLAILSWDALDDRSWPGVSDMEPADIARVLGVYATRVITPRGSTAVSGLELMTAVRPPTRAVRDEATGNWVSGYNPGSLGTEPMDPAPPEATAEHPVVVNSGWTGGFLDEEAYQWVRPVDLLSDDECLLPYAVGLDLNTAFLAAAFRLVVGLSAPDHFHTPQFNKKIPGSWLVDLSHIELDPRLPSPPHQGRRRRPGRRGVAGGGDRGRHRARRPRGVHPPAAQDAPGAYQLPAQADGDRESGRGGTRHHRRLRQPLPSRRPEEPAEGFVHRLHPGAGLDVVPARTPLRSRRSGPADHGGSDNRRDANRTGRALAEGSAGGPTGTVACC